MPEKTAENINRTARDLYQKAVAALQASNFDYAIDMFIQCLTIEPNFLRGRQYLRAAQLKRAETSGGFKRVMAAAKAAPALTKAKMMISKNPMEAMIMGEEILSTDPKNEQALLILAEAAESANYPETAVQTLEYYIKVNPRDTKTQHWLGRTYYLAGQYAKALDVYERLLQVNPNDFDAQRGIKDATAHGAMESGGWSTAGSYRDVIKDKDEAVALEQESRVVRAEDMIENLIKENLAKLEADPKNAVIQRELGRLYGQKGDLDTALRYLEKIYADEGGTDPSLEKELSDLKTKRLDMNLAEKKKHLAANPANATALQEEIATLEKERDLLSLKQTERLVERYPNDLMYRYDLGVLYMRTGNTGGAIDQFQKAQGQPQRRTASLNYLGQCFMREGHNDLAVDCFKKAIDEQPSMDNLKKDLIYNLGTAYETMGETEKAITEFKKIAGIDYGFRDVKEKIMRKAPPKPPSST